jgi:hypothetical protein
MRKNVEGKMEKLESSREKNSGKCNDNRSGKDRTSILS